MQIIRVISFRLLNFFSPHVFIDVFFYYVLYDLHFIQQTFACFYAQISQSFFVVIIPMRLLGFLILGVTDKFPVGPHFLLEAEAPSFALSLLFFKELVENVFGLVSCVLSRLSPPLVVCLHAKLRFDDFHPQIVLQLRLVMRRVV